MGIAQRGQTKVIDDQQLHLGQLAKQRALLAQRLGAGERFDQARQSQAADADLVLAGVMRKRAGEVALADAGRAGAITPGITAELSSCVISFTRCAACRFEWSACVDRSPERCSSLSGASSVVSACRSG